jgi:hypothetical protein
MIAALAYMIGDLQSNWKFKAASKKAADVNFQNVQKRYKSGEESAEGDLVEDVAQTSEQIKAFDTLEEVMKAQKSALKTKIGFTLGAQIGYAVADGVELANMGFMGVVCSQRWATFSTQKSLCIRGATTALSAVATAIASTYGTGAAVCSDVAANIGIKSAADAADIAAKVGVAAGKTAKQIQNSGKTISLIENFFSVISQLKTGEEVSSTIESSNKKWSKLEEELGHYEKVEEGIIAGEQAAAITEIGIKTATNLTSNLLATKCPGAGEIVKEYYACLDKDLTIPFMCCGGDGKTLAVESAIEIAESGQGNPVTIAKSKGVKQLLKSLINKAVNAATNSISSVTKLFAKKDDSANAPEGTSFAQGVPAAPGIASFKKDIKILSLFDLPKTSSIRNDSIKDLQFYLKNMFESNLRRHVANTFQVDPKDPIHTLKLFNDQEDRLNKVFNEYEKLLDSDIDYLIKNENFNTNSIAFTKFYKTIVNNIFIPEAEASGLTTTLIGAGLSFGASKIDGPWSSVLNVTGKLVTLHGLIGKFMKNAGLTSPVGRALTWTTLTLFSRMSWRMAKDSKDQVERNIAVLRNERDKFKNSAVNDNAMENGISGGSALNLVSVDYDAMLPGGRDTVCAKPSASGYAPRACDGKLIANNRFLNGSSGITVRNASNLGHLGAFNDVLGLTSRGANGLVKGSEFSESALTGFQNTYNALAKKNDALRAEVDKQNSRIKGAGESGKLSLQKRVEKIKQSLLNNAGGTMTNPFAAPTVASKSADKKDKEKKATGITGMPAVVGSVPTPGGSNDFDFGGENDSLLNDLSSDKEAISMSDFELKHDDINKKKDVSIFKLLSNRYILRYPKLMNEKKQKE